MSLETKTRPLPKTARRFVLSLFLDVLEVKPELAHFRALVPAGKDRRLALFAAMERSVFRGDPAECPPASEDIVDRLLCDLLHAIDLDLVARELGATCGKQRHQANLEALAAWHARPRALELFATRFSHLNHAQASTLPVCQGNFSPGSQVSGPNGDLIPLENGPADTVTTEPCLPQDMLSTELIVARPDYRHGGAKATEDRLNRHAVQNPGEKFGVLQNHSVHPDLPAGQAADNAAGTPAGLAVHGAGEPPKTADPSHMPPRPLRRGRPLVLDDLAKGRVLGLMAHGLSCRQAAAQLGVHHQTLLNAMKRDEEFAQQMAEARLDAIAQPLHVVVQAARTNWRAAAWLTKYLNDRRIAGIETTPEERELANMRG